MSSILQFDSYKEERKQKGDFDKWFAKDKNKAAILDEVMDYLSRRNCPLLRIYPAVVNQNHKLVFADNQQRNLTTDALFNDLINKIVNSQYDRKLERSRKAKMAHERREAERVKRQVQGNDSQNNR